MIGNVFRRLTESSHTGMILMNAEFGITYRSPLAIRIGDIITMDPEIREAVSDSIIPFTHDFHGTSANGQSIWVECTFNNMLHEPEVGAIVCSIRDITDRKNVEEELRRTIQELSAYKHALDESSIVAITDQKGIINHVNDNFCRISRYPREELIGQDHRIINSSYHDKDYIRDLWTTIARGNVWKGELRNRAKDGSHYWVDTTIVPFLNEDGKPYQYVAIRSDITERKLAELELGKRADLIESLLESITDGFVAVDKDMRYTYVNKTICEMVGLPPEAMLGQRMWDLFPDAVGSATYNAIQEALAERRYTSNEDYYPPLDLWQENRVYPTGKGLSIFIRDISSKKKEEHHLKLLQSVITSTTDAVMITEAQTLDDPGPRIVYVNEAFTRMTGYTADEVIGKSPRILQGPNTDRNELAKIRQAMAEWQPCESTVVNYRKNGEKFWMNMVINPVANESGWFTHWIAIERDVTASKNRELQKSLMPELGLIFNASEDLGVAVHDVLRRLVSFEPIMSAEVWLIGTDTEKINLSARTIREGMERTLLDDEDTARQYARGEALVGATWATGLVQTSHHTNGHSLHAIPLRHTGDLVGVLVFGLSSKERASDSLSALMNSVSSFLGPEIRRRQLEQELYQLFTMAPDSICIASTDGYAKRLNPALCAVLEYSETELLASPLLSFVHPDDHEQTSAAFRQLGAGEPVVYLENRMITRSGSIKWMAWTGTPLPEEGLFFSVAKDISYKKELEDLLLRANTMARIGSWEVDLVRQTVYWSNLTREIHEVGPDFMPDMENTASFYHEGEDKARIQQVFADCVQHGTPFDVEFEITTARGNLKWIRAKGEAEFKLGTCTRVYGSFQDIDDRKKAELLAIGALEEKNTILESIGDAFFAIDMDWTVTYWNNMASKVLLVPRHDIVGRNLWDVFPAGNNPVSYATYSHALQTKQAVHFEDYYAPLEQWYEISAYPSAQGLSVYLKDISDRKASEIRLTTLNESLSKQTKELAISNAELEQFAYVASHDLQEPVRMVTSFLTQLEKKYGDTIDNKGKQYIYFAVDGAKRMRQIILDLLEFSRVGRTVNKKEAIDLNELVDEVEGLHRKQIDESGATIDVAPLPTLMSYRAPIRQVFQNLISNGLKYQPPGNHPVVRIAFGETDTHWEFSVSDNGIGIDSEYFDRIFIIFQRLHNKDEYTGTGMGLAVTRKIIETLGGRIWVDSEPGKGSTFSFTISKMDHPLVEQNHESVAI